MFKKVWKTLEFLFTVVFPGVCICFVRIDIFFYLRNTMKTINEIVIKNHFHLHYRPQTTDEKVIDEVLKRNVYERQSLDFLIEEGETWLDLGANIGTFSLICLSRGARVVSFEPEPENYQMLVRNIDNNPHFVKKTRVKAFKKAVGLQNGIAPLYLCKGDYNKYRHTLCPKRGRVKIEISVVSITDVIKKYKPTCIKMDIEGAEIEILEGMLLKSFDGIHKLVFEYSFDVDRSIPRFMAIIKKLRQCFAMVHYDKVRSDELEYKYFPACTLVFCKK